MTNKESRRTAEEALEALRRWSGCGSELERLIKGATAERVINGDPDIFADERKTVQRRPTIRLEAFIYVKLGQAFVLACSGLLLGGVLKLFTQCVFWLHYGYWQPYSLQSRGAKDATTPRTTKNH